MPRVTSKVHRIHFVDVAFKELFRRYAKLCGRCHVRTFLSDLAVRCLCLFFLWNETVKEVIDGEGVLINIYLELGDQIVDFLF